MPTAHAHSPRISTVRPLLEILGTYNGKLPVYFSVPVGLSGAWTALQAELDAEVSDGEADGKFSLKDLTGRPLSRKSGAGSDSSGDGNGDIPGENTLETKYRTLGEIAAEKGASSVQLVQKLDHPEKRLCAVKEFRPRRSEESKSEYVKKLTSEFCVASALHHQNVVETVDLMKNYKGRWCVMREFCAGGDLHNAIVKGGMSPAEVECCFKQILTGVGYIHDQGVAHRDLKPENLFFDAKGQVKIGDFGASTIFRLPWKQTIHKSNGLCGSEPYTAPEQFTWPASYDARLVDIWACGIIYYRLCFSELPWSSAQPSDKNYSRYAEECAAQQLSMSDICFLETPPIPSDVPISTLTAVTTLPAQPRLEFEQEAQKEQTTVYPSTIHYLTPAICRPVLRRMLEPNPEYRATIEEVLEDPWVQSVEVCTLPGALSTHTHGEAIVATAPADRFVAGILSDER